MITLNVVEKKVNQKTKIVSQTKKFYLFNSVDKARKFLQPIVSEMITAKKMKREPMTYIEGVSFDTKSEKTFLVEIGAVDLTPRAQEEDL